MKMPQHKKKASGKNAMERAATKLKSGDEAVRTKPADMASPPRHSFPVAGIGASAGGLEALTALLKHLSMDTGMAFVVVQHLSPTHEGILASLLAKTTKMPVREVTNGLRVEPNHVYVIPPNANMAIADGVLNLLPRQVTQGQTRSIDFFFQSLAAARGHESVGIILSGTASDGTIGLEAIKAEGGITFAQDESAKFDSMPRSAIAAGCVDFVLPPPGIARELARLASHPYVVAKKGLSEEEEQLEPGDDFKKVLAIVRRSSGNDFGAYKSATLERRLHRRMMLGKFKDLPEYIAYLNSHAAEVDALTADFLIGVTNFFRDPSAFEFLKKKVFPKMLKAHQSRPHNEALRFWVLGCSTGQETYSLAMAWLEFANAAQTSVSLQIFSTDVHNPYLERARAGVYSKSLLQDISPERLRRFFVEVDGGYRVTKLIRDMCVFAKQNIVSDPPFSHIDLVSCRNLLIYLRPELQRKIVPIFHFALKPAGFLFLGPAETVTGFAHLFAPFDSKMKVFTRKPGPTQVDARFVPSPLPFPKVREPARALSEQPAAGVDAQREADRLMLSKYAPAGVLINANLEVLQYRGYTGRYLEAPPGKATLNILKMAREGLLSPLRNALKQAVKQNAPIKVPGVVLKENGRSFSIGLDVIPLKHSNEEQRCFLVNFEPTPEPVTQPAVDEASPVAVREGKGNGPDTAQVRRELAETRDHLQSVIEQQDAYNEELQSANEEAQAANEELQSINEEMETAKEELQASNEELTTVNEELNARNHEMALTTNDLTNLLTSVNIPIVMLGRDLCIRRFTTQAERILHITAGDVGRALTDLTLNIPIPDLEQTLLQVIENVTSREQEVQDREGRWYALRLRPYLTSDNKIDGAVMLLMDVDELKRNQKEIAEAREYAEHIVETIGDALLVLDHTLIVQSANQSFYEMFRVSPQETRKRYIYGLGSGEWDLPEFRQLLEEMLPKNQEIHDFEVEQDFPRIGRRIMRLNARRFIKSASHRDLILLAITDITERTRIERELAEKARLLDLSNDAIMVRGFDDRISLWNKGAEFMYGWKAEEVIGKDLHALMHTVFPKPVEEIVAQLHREGHFKGEVIQTARDGRRIATLCRWVLDAETQSILTSYTDISERKHAEEAQARELADAKQLQSISSQLIQEDNIELLYRQIVNSATAIMRSDMGSIQTFYPDRGELRLLAWKGFDPEAAKLWERVGTDACRSCGESLRTGLRVIVPDTERCEFVTAENLAAYRKLGVRAMQSTPLVSRGGKIVGMISTHWREVHQPAERELRMLDVLARQAADLIERKQNEDALRRSETSLRLIFEHVEDFAIFSMNQGGRVTDWNPGAERIFGYKREEVLGQDAAIVFTPEDRAASIPEMEMQTAQKEGYALDERWHLRKNGERFFASGAMRPLRDAGGQLLGFVKVARDVTERKRNEETLQHAQTQLSDRAGQLEKLVAERTARLQETVGELESYSYSIAHDMRAPLRSMSSYARLVQTEHGGQLDEAGKDYLGRIVSAAKRLDHLVTDVLNYSSVSRRKLQLRPVNLEKLLDEAIRNQPEFQSPRAEIQICPPLQKVIAHEPSLMQVVNNLLGNAVKFVLPGVVPRVTVRSELVGQDVRLWFEDNGIGIAAADVNRIFSLFGRLNPTAEFEGTGIGLAIVRKSVERMGGKVGVESEPGQGSRFWIQLKRSD